MIATLSKPLKLSIPAVSRQLSKNRRELQLEIGIFKIHVLESSSKELTVEEWNTISQARKSYFAMWGGGDLRDEVKEDPFDGRVGDLYDTKHYIATVTNQKDKTSKVIVARKVSANIKCWTEEQLKNPYPWIAEDFSFWEINDLRIGKNIPLWDLLRNHLKKASPQAKYPEFDIPAISRVATLPFSEINKTPQQRDRTPIAFAAIQLLATDSDASPFHTLQIRQEFQDKVMVLSNISGRQIKFNFAKTEDVLALPKESMHLRRKSPHIRKLKINFPGYFLNSTSACELIRSLFEDGTIAAEDFISTIKNIYDEADRRGKGSKLCTILDQSSINLSGKFSNNINYQLLAETLTAPTTFKHITNRLHSDLPFANISCNDFKEKLINEVKDGPFSVLIRPSDIRHQAELLLLAAQRKYA